MQSLEERKEQKKQKEQAASYEELVKQDASISVITEAQAERNRRTPMETVFLVGFLLLMFLSFVLRLFIPTFPIRPVLIVCGVIWCMVSFYVFYKFHDF